jgi:hypothetical protein
MRALLVTVLALLALLPAAPVQAAGSGPLLQDAQGDAAFTLSALGTPLPDQPGPTDMAANADLLALDLLESEDAVSFVITVASLKGDVVESNHEVTFTWAKRDFILSVYYFDSKSLGGHGMYGWLSYVEGEDWNGLGAVEVVVDADKGTLTAVVPKVYVMDAKDRNPGRGDSLEDIRVASEGLEVNVFVLGTRYHDAMPDGDGQGAAFPFQMGDYALGSLRLSSPERVRVSNGGSTTFVYTVTVGNVADAENEYDLSLSELPEGWNATVQSPVRVPPKGEKSVAILASVPFAHTHGGYDAFNLSVSSKTDPAAQGRMRFGVLHTPIPQPAGHHSEIYLHSSGRSESPFTPVFDTVDPYGFGTINTLPDHAGDAAFATINYYSDGEPGWYLPLSPGLRMGLDFDVERLGALEGTLDNVRPGDIELRAVLTLYTQGDEIVLAESEPLTLTGEARKPLPFSLTLTPTEASDYVPYQKEQYLALFIRANVAGDVGGGRATEPRIVTDSFKMTLPLEEYHDRLSGVADAAAILDLRAEGPVEKAGRPGTIVTYLFDLTNGGSTEDSFDMDLAGSDARRAQVVPGGAITLGPRESKRVTVAVSVPSDAAAGEELEVLLFAHGVDDPSKTAIARTKTRVSLGDDAVADESAVLTAAREAENETPAPGLALVAAGLVGAALAARRRGRA